MAILTIEEGRDVLRLDGTDNDAIIQAFIDAIPAYLEMTTGKAWDEEPIPELAKLAAKFILQQWYYQETEEAERLKRAIDGLLTVLTVKAQGA